MLPDLKLVIRLQEVDNRLADLIFMPGADRDIGAFIRQRICNRAPDAARAAEYDGVLCFEMKIHVPPAPISLAAL